MAHAQGTSLRGQRLSGIVASAILAVATSLAFGRVFAGQSSTWRLMGVAAASVLVASALERRGLVLATVVSAALLLVTVGLLVFPKTTWYGLPTLDTVRHALDASRLVGQQARLQVSPTVPLKPLFLAAVVAIWAAMFSSHALAFRARSPLLALLPPITLLAFADTVLEELIKPAYGVAFLLGALALAFADALRRVQAWGPVWAAAGAWARRPATAGRGARRVGVAAVAVAALAPVLVPGFGSKAIIDISSTSSQDRIRIDPLVSIKASLTRRDPVEVFQVRTSAPSYWRMLSLPTFDGDTWRPDNTVQGVAITPQTTLDPGPPGLAVAPPNGQPIEQVFQVSNDLGLPWLPVAYPPQRIDVPESSVRFDPETGTALLDSNLDAGAVYRVTSYAVQPAPEQLAATVFPTPAQNARYTALPSDMPPEIRQIAERWTAGAANDYERILAIQDRLTDTSVFTYDINVPARDDSYTLVDFLTVTRTGFCQQFASAMAVMLRTLGLPARVAVGFTAGAFDRETGTWRVTTDEAHSWVEVLFPSYGWLAFEPTPGRNNPVASGYQHPEVVCPSGVPSCGSRGGAGAAGGATGAQGDTSGLPQQLRNLIDRPIVRTGSRSGPLPGAVVPGEGSGRRRAIGTVVVILVGAMLLAAIGFPPIRALGRRIRRLRAGREPRALILASYDVFADRAADLGYARAPGETLDEYRRRLRTAGATTDGHLDRLTSIAVRAAYSPDDPTPTDAREASDAASTAIRDLRRRTSLGRRIVGQYRLSR